MKCLVKRLALLMLGAALLTPRAVQSSDAVDPRMAPEALFAELLAIDPRTETGLERLVTIGTVLADTSNRPEANEEKPKTDDAALKDLPPAELQRRFASDTQVPGKRESRGVAAIQRLAGDAFEAPDSAQRAARIAEILEVQSALRAARHPSLPRKLGLVSSWVLFFRNSHRGIARGTVPAANLAHDNSEGPDFGRIDPAPSTFWTRPADIAAQDLAAGFGRAQAFRLGETICVYDAPKTSSGTNPGFDVECNGERYKIKFGELHSEPFTARIFHALGYHVDPTDYVPRLKVRYDRRLFREFHLRQPLEMRLKPLGIPAGTIRLQRRFDPFNYVVTAVFKDGREISGAALKQSLFIDPNRAHPEDSPENFRREIESSLDYLVMAPANVQARDTPAQSLGPWEFGGLGHEHRRELRGAALLAAWLAWFDSRTENTKLRIQRGDGPVRLEHYFTDLGGGMGSGKGWFSPHGEDANELPWTFTRPEIVRGPGRMTTPFRIIGFRPVVPTPAFAAMTLDDARWMARLIGQLTEDQLQTALAASGYEAAEARLYLEKLICRRDQMVRDLGLADEVRLLRPAGVDREFSFKPANGGKAVVRGRLVEARAE